VTRVPKRVVFTACSHILHTWPVGLAFVSYPQSGSAVLTAESLLLKETR